MGRLWRTCGSLPCVLAFAGACAGNPAAETDAPMLTSDAGTADASLVDVLADSPMDAAVDMAMASSDDATILGVDASDAAAEDVGSDAGTPDADVGPRLGLTTDQRRAHLRYYAPLLLKRSSESGASRGSDWISNFDFDGNGIFADNKANWEDIEDFVDGAHADWQIRPTMYTALIEWMEDGAKSLILLYHVYNAKQQGSIHDWERIEIRIDDVEGDPGGDESVAYVVVTEHSKHNNRRAGDADLNFMSSGDGHHVMIWQAESRDAGPMSDNIERGELHFATESWSRISGRSTARTDINGAGPQAYHYLFVPEDDAAAVAELGARPITPATARSLSSGVSVRPVDTEATRRVTYELQDLADIFPTHHEANADAHWTGPTIRIQLMEPLAPGIAGSTMVPAGLQTFVRRSQDSEDGDEDRQGYPYKHWFWGAYEMGDSSIVGLAYGEGHPRNGRAAANGDPSSLGSYWHQHDYFAHTGARGGDLDDERGEWLPAGWHLESEGGFDGRWVQLFDNRR